MDESQGYSWDNFKQDMQGMQRSEKTHCPLCGSRKVEENGELVCPNHCGEEDETDSDD